jgi:hypothetical protein
MKEQEEYIALHGHRESDVLEADTVVAIEWACKREGECSCTVLMPCIWDEK